MDDQELLKLLAGGNQEVFAQIYDKYWQKLFAYAYNLMKDTDQCEDLIQDVFISLWERRETLRIENLKAYLFSSVRYSVYRVNKQQGTRGSLSLTNDFELADIKASAADDSVISAELQLAYEQLLDKMPPQRKRVFQMRHEDNLTTNVIAEKLQIAQKTVQNHLVNSYQQIQSLITTVLVFLFLSFLP
ncbi:RNA polymerase sigma-70 factor [Mucilaginibacter gynuensis]|uniref:RNA polymerase sigma-70 factor n=1 Tax=Mucilaginibacter gynuensis TaxID=1302236 RepID=A0ABP8FXB9_9SPHI